MGTISDKLMRIINTKEDIRQALISKGYDVPTSIPFKEYAKMISDLPCRVDSFPDIEGIVARYSALGLTNEQMKENPVWVDKTGNGHDLQMKNFIWGGMSGIGGYNQNFNQWGYGNLSTATQTHTSYKIELSVPSTLKTANIYSNANSIGKEGDVYDFTLNIVGLKDGALLLITKGVVSGVIERIEKDGIYKIYQPIEAGWDQSRIYIFISNPNSIDLNITIEQLPIYPGALVFDGVDDYGTCDNFPILTKEKGYTVVALRQWDQDFLNTTLTGGLLSTRNYSTGEGVAFEKIESSNKGYWNLGAGGIIDFAKSPFTWQTSKQYNNVGILKGDKNHGKPLCVGCGLSGGQQCGRFAIWELVFLDHDATEEELTKIKDYFVKTYPWLFPDQAWTVVGKTNEDEDRATIANITGNGNDLILSNLGFAEGSGYGLYAQNYISYAITNRAVYTKTNSSIHVTKSITAGVNFTESARDVTIPSYRIKVTGIQSGQEMIYRGSNNTFLTNIPSDGIYVLPAVENGSNLGFQFVSYTGDCDITIEQIPEYEGYLVTDGVDDKIVSSSFEMGKDFTIVGDWKFIDNKKSGTGLVKGSSFYIYNTMIGLDLYINSGSVKNSLDGIKSINAACSDGRAYDRNWNEILANTGNVVGSGGTLEVSSSGGRFDRIAFKNLAIYPRILSKDDCIKAYNYLQTLKSK